MLNDTRSLPTRAEWSEQIRAAVGSGRVELCVSADAGRLVGRPDEERTRAQEQDPAPADSSFVLDGHLLSGALARGTRDLQHQFHDLGAEFIYPLAPLLNELRVQGGLLIVLADVLNMPDERVGPQPDMSARRRWAEARELYREGCAKAGELLFPEALEWLRKAEDRYPTDFSIQFELGWVQLYGVSRDDDVVDPAAAEQHLRKAVRYGKGAVRRRRDMAAPTAEALLHLSIACCLLGRLPEALELAAEACEINPNLCQAYYHRAKYSALLGHREDAMDGLRAALALDRRLALTLDTDRDLSAVGPEIDHLLQQMRDSALAAAEIAVAESAGLAAMRDDVAELKTRQGGLETRLRNLEAQAGRYPVDYSELPGVSIEVRRGFDEDLRTVRRSLEKLGRVLDRADRSLAESTGLFDCCRALQAEGTLFALQDVLPRARDALMPLRRATANLTDAHQFVTSCDDRLPGLEVQLPALAAEVARNRQARRHWWVRDLATRALQRIPGFAVGGALAGVVLRVGIFFAGSEFGAQKFGWLVGRAAWFAGLGAAAGVLAAVLWSVRRFTNTGSQRD